MPAATNAVAAQARAKSAKKFEVVMDTSNGYFVDNDPSGNSGGDLFGSAGPLTSDGDGVGKFASACTLSPPVGGECQATFILRGRGRLQVAGLVRLNGETNRLSVVGGTGNFRAAQGTVVVEALDDMGGAQLARFSVRR